MTELMTPPRPRSKRQPSRLTDRDLAILQSIQIARYMTVGALEWLHVPTWQTRWERHQQQTPEKPYRPATYLYERLHFLLANDWILRLRRMTQIGDPQWRRQDDLYLLTPAGAQLLAEWQQIEVEEIAVPRKRPRSYFTLTHGAEIGIFYAALRARMAMKAGLTMEDWRGEHLTAKAYDYVMVQRRTGKGTAEVARLPIQPDATFVWRHPGGAERIFVEIDRGTRSLVTWREKMHAYAAYFGSEALKARYGVETFMLLTVTPTDTQRRKLMMATAGVLGRPNGRFVFGLLEDVHPLRIGAGWHKLGTISPSQDPLRPTITTEPYTLIT